MPAISSINPTNEQVLKTFETATDEELDTSLELASTGYKSIKAMTLADRGVLMQKVADILEDGADDYGQILTAEMGKTLVSAVAEVRKCAKVCRHYAEHAEKYLDDRRIETEASSSYVRYLPVGPILAVMPWNFPFWQVFRCAAPTLMAGNSVVLKHASNVPKCALSIEKIFHDAGFVPGALVNVFADISQVEKIIDDDRVQGVALTGSEGAGSAVAALAGKALKPSVLELGGSDAFIVMPSADIEAALDAAVFGRCMNNGQSCIAAKRFLVHRDIYNVFRDGFVSRFEALKVGDPLNKSTDIGPLALPNIRDNLDRQVNRSIDKGARILTGAKLAKGESGKGYFYEPGILEAPGPDAPAYSEELFGPVGTLFEVEDMEAAVTLANSSRFGLGSTVFTHEESEAEYGIVHLEAGSTFINANVASDPRLPFGGVKSSGYGRELSEEGIRVFTNAKTIYIK